MTTVNEWIADMKPGDLLAARYWIADVFEDVDPFDLDPLEVARGIRRHYAGGIGQFLADGDYSSYLRRAQELTGDLSDGGN